MDTTKTHILPYEFILHPITGKVIVYSNSSPSKMMTVSKAEAQFQLMREDLDVHRRLLYEKVLETYNQ